MWIDQKTILSNSLLLPSVYDSLENSPSNHEYLQEEIYLRFSGGESSSGGSAGWK
jgi:hypothetical protein